MSSLQRILKTISNKNAITRKIQGLFICQNNHRRTYSDTPKGETETKQIMVQGESEEKFRVRRARPSDVPRVLQFVREHARSTWPSMGEPSISNLVMSDYVSRALAQGHSMLAEQHETHRGWSRIRGLALALSVCPWDATILEQWAKCVSCTKSRNLMHLTAHCLRAPALHDKYKVHNILQVILIVPPGSSKNTELIHLLTKNAIQRGRDVGFRLLRLDVTNDNVAKSLEDLQLNKEWQLSLDALPTSIKGSVKEIEKSADASQIVKSEENNPAKTVGKNFITVFTVLTQSKV